MSLLPVPVGGHDFVRIFIEYFISYFPTNKLTFQREIEIYYQFFQSMS